MFKNSVEVFGTVGWVTRPAGEAGAVRTDVYTVMGKQNPCMDITVPQGELLPPHLLLFCSNITFPVIMKFPSHTFIL